MYAKVYGATIDGLDGVVVTVEVDISQGLPVFDIVGLPNQAVKESRERVRAAKIAVLIFLCDVLLLIWGLQRYEKVALA